MGQIVDLKREEIAKLLTKVSNDLGINPILVVTMILFAILFLRREDIKNWETLSFSELTFIVLLIVSTFFLLIIFILDILGLL